MGLDRLEQRIDQQTRAESKTRLVEQIGTCVRSGDYSRALDLLRGTAAEFPNDADLSELEKAAQDGVKRKAEADRLITESQDLFAQRKSAEAIQLLRKAYELDKRNSLARSILANALVEHAHSIIETDWLEAENLSNQALALNPSHPTAKSIQSLVVDQKKTSSVDDWVANARKRQSSGDLFAALAWVAEGLAVHPDDSKLLQIQDAIQRDQAAQRRQARRGDVEELRRMASKIDATADVAAKQALAERIQAVAAKSLDGWRNLSHRQHVAAPAGFGTPGGFHCVGAQERRGRHFSCSAPQRSRGCRREYQPGAAKRSGAEFGFTGKRSGRRCSADPGFAQHRSNGRSFAKQSSAREGSGRPTGAAIARATGRDHFRRRAFSQNQGPIIQAETGPRGRTPQR